MVRYNVLFILYKDKHADTNAKIGSFIEIRQVLLLQEFLICYYYE